MRLRYYFILGCMFLFSGLLFSSPYLVDAWHPGNQQVTSQHTVTAMNKAASKASTASESKNLK